LAKTEAREETAQKKKDKRVGMGHVTSALGNSPRKVERYLVSKRDVKKITLQRGTSGVDPNRASCVPRQTTVWRGSREKKGTVGGAGIPARIRTEGKAGVRFRQEDLEPSGLIEPRSETAGLARSREEGHRNGGTGRGGTQELGAAIVAERG